MAAFPRSDGPYRLTFLAFRAALKRCQFVVNDK